MLKIAICDDEKNVCNSLENSIDQYMKIKSLQYTSDVFYSADSMIQHMNGGNTYDLIFLDIEMEGLDGIEFGEILRNDMRNEVTKIIYISWKDSYAMRLFKVRPTDFIIKPLTEDRIFEVLAMTMKLIKNETQCFCYQSNNLYEKINSNEILYFESSNRKVWLHTLKGKVEFYEKLEKVSKRVDSKYFWRIHKSYIINYLNVRTFDYKRVIMNNDIILPISQTYRAHIRSLQKIVLREEK